MIQNKTAPVTNPLPNRKSGEKQDDFVGRCMGDEKMKGEYPEQEQRLAVCYSHARRKRKGPKANEGTAEGWAMDVIHALTNNVDTRRERWEGRDYMVFPVVALKEGVHAGSEGPLFYPEEELEKFVESWNNRPIPVFHPATDDGQPISSNSPAVIATQSVGHTFNFFYDRAARALKGEMWVDIVKADQVHPGLMAQMSKQMEVSTGLFSEREASPGEYNGEQYAAVARNYRPDHVALLPGGRGACNWGDGCGIRVNAQDGTEKPAGEENNMGMTAKLKELALVAMNVVINVKAGGKISHEDLRRAIQGIVNTYDGPRFINFLRAVYDDYFVYAAEPTTGMNPSPVPSAPAKLYRQDYEMNSNGSPTTKGDAVEVREETKFVPVENTAAGANKPETNSKEDPKMGDKKKCCEEKVQMLIEHEGTRFEEKDREWLLSLNEEQIERLVPVEKKPAEKPADNAAADKAKADAAAAAMVVAAQANQGQSVDQYIASAPAEMRGMLANAFREYKAKKAELVTALLANKNCRFTKEALEAMETEALVNLTDLAKGAAVAPAPAGDYSGRAPAPVVHSDKAEEPLGVPKVSDFALKK